MTFSSNRGFAPGLGLDGPRPNTAEIVITAAPFGVAPRDDRPAGQFQPMVFQPFDGLGTIVSVQEPDEVQAPSVEDALAEIEVVEAVPPLPPPPDFEALKAEAREEGYAQGLAEGLQAATDEQQALTTRLGALLHDVAADNEELVRGLEANVVELALAIAEKVIAREVKTDPGIVLDVVRSALAEIHDATELRIRCHPDDVALLEPRWEAMLPRSVAERSELVPEDLVEQGGVVVETRIGYVDGQLKTRLNQVVTAFQGVLDGEPT
jgi:flagellar assembly protein FliH